MPIKNFELIFKIRFPFELNQFKNVFIRNIVKIYKHKELQL